MIFPDNWRDIFRIYILSVILKPERNFAKKGLEIKRKNFLIEGLLESWTIFVFCIFPKKSSHSSRVSHRKHTVGPCCLKAIILSQKSWHTEFIWQWPPTPKLRTALAPPQKDTIYLLFTAKVCNHHSPFPL